MTTTKTNNVEAVGTAAQQTWLGNGNEAVAQAILHIGFDGEGYYPITPSSDAGEEVSKAVAAGKTNLRFVIGTSELAVISIVTGMAIAGGRVVDITSANGLMLKLEELPAISGLGLPVVLNIATREISAPLNIKNSHTDLVTTLGLGWLILCASSVQAVYDLNIIGTKWAEAVNLPVIIAYDGFHTSHGGRRIKVFASEQDVRDFLGPVPPRPSILDVDNPKTFGPYMNDDIINNKVQLEMRMEKAAKVLPSILEQYAQLTGRRYDFVQHYGDEDAEVAMVMLNTAGETAKDAVDVLKKQGKKRKLIIPTVLRPFPEAQLVSALKDCKKILVAERASQYGAGNYLANEIGAALQRAGSDAAIIERTYGLGGLNFYLDDALALFDIAERWPDLDDPNEKRRKWFYGAWPGDPNYQPAPTLEPIREEQCRFNADGKGVNLRKLSAMPTRFTKHAACPGCGIFANLNLFLRGIDGHVVLLFNTGCGMVVTTGFPKTSFRVPYFHNLFHNASSTATGIVEMYHKLKAEGRIPDREITVIAVTGDGGNDIGMDQCLAAALRNDPFIMLEYDNKGYMNTGGQMCYTGFKGERSSNAPVGPAQPGKKRHHKDMMEILRGTFAPYLAQAADSHPADMIRKARQAQATVRAGGFAYVKVLSVCPLNWGMNEKLGPQAVAKCVDACLHPLYEVHNGITTINYDPEAKGKKIPVTDAFAVMGAAFRHLTKPEYAELAAEIQAEVDMRWGRLKEMAANPKL